MEPDRIRNLWRYRPGVDKMASSGISARYDPLADEKLPPDGSRLPGAKLPRPVHTGTDLTGRALSQPLQYQSLCSGPGARWRSRSEERRVGKECAHMRSQRDREERGRG